MSGLAGRRVVLTRTPQDAAAWSAPLIAAGAEVVNLPCIRTETSTDPTLPAALGAALARADWLMLTSRRGVEALADVLDAATVDAKTRIAVVGEATAKAARASLGRADLIGSGTAAVLASEIAADERFAPGQRVVAALAANAGDQPLAALSAQGAVCDRFDVYRTIPHPREAERRVLSTLAADAVIFSSPTTVRGFLNQIDVDCAARLYSIGPSTSAALRDAGLPIAGEARKPDILSIIEIISQTIEAPPSVTEDARHV